MSPLSTRGISDGLVAALAALSVQAALLLNFLRFAHYPLLSAEVGIVALVLAAEALLFGLVYHFLPLLLRALLEAAIIILVVSTYTIAPLPLAAATGLTLLFVIALRRSLLPFLGLLAFFALIAGLVGIGQEKEGPLIQRAQGTAPAVTGGQARPLLVHLILDEHIGVEGLPADNPRSAKLKETLKSFYAARGFRLFGRAHSEYFDTADSIPHTLNLGGVSVTDPALRTRNAYFNVLRADGFAVHVYTPDVYNLCRSQSLASCTTYRGESFQPVAKSSLTTGIRAKLILLKFSGLGRLYRAVWRKGVPLPAPDFDVEARVHTLTALTVFDTFNSDLRGAKPGDAFVGHILLPHYPYSTKPDCEVKNRDLWLSRETASVRRRQDAYFDQIECSLRKVDEAYRTAAAASGGNFIMIVQGDHGSRIMDVDPRVGVAGKLKPADFVAGFSTLFAVRAPGLAPGYDSVPCSLVELLSGVAKSGLRPDRPMKPECSVPTAYLRGGDPNSQKRVPLPATW